MNDIILSILLMLSSTQEPVSMDALVTDLLRRDVVMLGEEHDSTRGHALQLEIIRALGERSDREIVISMEMFERDVQGVLDDYLRGRIDEKTFLAHARPWPNYAEHYRAIIEWAKDRGADVIAANAPRRLARRVSFQGLDGLKDRRHVARETTSPSDRYFELFKDTMSGHVGIDAEGAMERMYASQCLKDDTMAESISDYLEARPYRRPIIVHLCGKFHSDYGLGTVIRLLQRRPLTDVAVLTMATVDKVEPAAAKDEFAKAHYVALIQKEPQRVLADAFAGEEEAVEDPVVNDEVEVDEVLVEAEFSGEEPVKAVVVAESTAVVTVVKPEAEVPSGAGKPTPAPAAKEPTKDIPAGRAAFGFMPDYAAVGGVGIGSVTAGGPAAKAGLKDGDLLLAVDGRILRDLEAYMDLMDGLRPGQEVKAKVRRGAEELEFRVTLGARP